MPPANNNTQPQNNPFEIVTSGKSKKGSAKGIIIALVVVLFLALGIFGGVLLVRQNQNIQEKAVSEQCTDDCGVSTPERLVVCNNASCDNSAISLCNAATYKGRIEKCGGKQYCCNGTAWTNDMSSCAEYALCSWPQKATVATATATATSTATATATATSTSASSTKTASPTPTSTKTSTAKATSTSVATKAPIPQTGTGWPTYAGIGLGVLVIVGSLLLAL